ncbi:MAG: hypothetical protein OEY49_03435 [Candidatus Heimdallarchaeota archaeon]|nr:hypothetical protein [Candidatus Heimdallarchaeota archaeon]
MIGGGYFVKGGSQKLSDALANTITKYGGTIVLKHLVEEIIIENKIAVGVKYRRQKRPTEGELIAYGKIIIANAAIPNVVNKLIPSMKNDEYTKQINSLELPCSLISIYIAFSEDISQLVDNRYSTFIYNEEVNTLKDFTKFERNGDYLKKGMVFVNYDAIDNGLSTEKYHIASICAIDYIDNWKFKEKEEYKKRKDEVTQIFLEKLENTFPGIKKYVVYTEMSTPRTIERYTLNPNGIVYGFAQTPKQAMLNRRKYSKSPVKNLYFASAWGFPGGGFGGTIAGGYMTALKILKKDKD